MGELESKDRSSRMGRPMLLVGAASLLWLVFRTGPDPSRLRYPCQRAALAGSLGFIGYVLSLLGTAYFYRRFKRRRTLAGLGLLVGCLLVTSTLLSGDAHVVPSYAALTLQGWTSATAVSDVFVVSGVPIPRCSLDGGILPGAPPCNSAAYALRDAGVDRLVSEMESRGKHFYRTASHPNGIVGSDHVVVIKVNNQWGLNGHGNGVGRLSTNTDVLKGVIWRILQHPEGFTGEIVVAENTQDSGAGWDTTPANSQDRNQSYQDVVNAFTGLGYPVSISDWTALNGSLISGGTVNGPGYPNGEYARGNTADAYILIEDPDGSGTNELSYPKFRTSGGNYVSMRYGIWNGSAYNADRLTFINMPVLKRHGMAGATIAWKNLIGFTTTYDADSRYAGWDVMHDYYWGYIGGANQYFGLLGRQLAYIRAPELHVVDAIWVADDNYDGDATRQNVLVAGTDPFAVDWYASEFVLRPLMTWDPNDVSAARGGVFRNATRRNQNMASTLWPGGGYPYMDLLDGYDGSTPSDGERNQMNVYVASAAESKPKAGVPLMLLLD